MPNNEDSTHDDGPPPKRQKQGLVTIEEDSDEEDPWEHDTDCDAYGICKSCCIQEACTTKDGRYLQSYEDGPGCGELCEFCEVPKGPHKMRDGVENKLTELAEKPDKQLEE